MTGRGFAAPNLAATAVTVPEAATVTFNRPALVDQQTAADMIVCRYNGGRTGYHNEYGELRAVAALNNTVALRARRRTSAATANIFEVCDEGNNPFVAVTADGRVTISAAWLAPTYATNAANAGTPKFDVGSRLEPGGVVRLRGQVNVSGSFDANTTLVTLPADHSPAAQVTFATRTGGTGAVSTMVDISTGGAVSVRVALVAGAQVYLDGLTFSN